jgi:hypothetical protein
MQQRIMQLENELKRMQEQQTTAPTSPSQIR